ncbi:MAG: hypothetical protein M3165_10515 [Actinomycetota bacterium]|nr:hypothetical protein [Actinomycetota bacterium]
MRPHTDPRPGHTGRAEHPRVDVVVQRLVHSGLVDADRADEAGAVVRAALTAPLGGEAPLRRRLAEVAGYVGGALVVAAALVFLAEEWDALSTPGRVATLTVIGLVLFGAAAVARTGRTDAADRQVRRRLSGALACGAVAALGSGVGVYVDAQVGDRSSVPWLSAWAAALLVAVAGYLLAHSALGHLVLAVCAYMVVNAAVEVAEQDSGVVLGLLTAALGLGWVVLAERHAWWERYVGLATGCALVLVGAQTPVLAADGAWVGYLLTASAAAAAVVLYTRSRALPYLVAAVAGITLVVPEALLDWTQGSLGPVGALLVTGVTLLGASLLGLRLRQEVGAPAQ